MTGAPRIFFRPQTDGDVRPAIAIEIARACDRPKPNWLGGPETPDFLVLFPGEDRDVSARVAFFESRCCLFRHTIEIDVAEVRDFITQ